MVAYGLSGRARLPEKVEQYLLMNLCVAGRRLFVKGQNKDSLDLSTPFY
jgi:hypothetical protein